MTQYFDNQLLSFRCTSLFLSGEQIVALLYLDQRLYLLGHGNYPIPRRKHISIFIYLLLLKLSLYIRKEVSVFNIVHTSNPSKLMTLSLFCFAGCKIVHPTNILYIAVKISCFIPYIVPYSPPIPIRKMTARFYRKFYSLLGAPVYFCPGDRLRGLLHLDQRYSRQDTADISYLVGNLLYRDG